MAVHFVFSKRFQQFVDTSSILQSLYSLTRKPSIYSRNPEFLQILVTHLHITNESQNSERILFCSLLEHGNDDLRHFCLTQIRANLAEQTQNEEYVIWCLPLIVMCIGSTNSLTVFASSILEDIVVVCGYGDLVVSTLFTYKQCVPYLIDQPECNELILRLIAMPIGFELFENGFGVVSKRFEEFMVRVNEANNVKESGIYEYVMDMENNVTAGLVQNPATYPTASQFLDHDESLFINPLRLQPPRNIIDYMLRTDAFQLQWLLQLPLKVECVNHSMTVDTSLDIVLSQLQVSGMDQDHSSVRVIGTFVSSTDHDVMCIPLHEGEEVKCVLCVGSEGLINDHLGCTVNERKKTDIQRFEMYWNKNSKRFLELQKDEFEAKRVGERVLLKNRVALGTMLWILVVYRQVKLFHGLSYKQFMIV